MIDNIHNYNGIVVSSKANFFNVDIHVSNSQSQCQPKTARILCTTRNKLKYSGKRVYVGDNVLVESIDWKLNKGVVYKVNERKNLFNRPLVANVSNMFILLSLSQPSFAFDQASRFLLTAEQTGVDVSLVLTKSDLLSLNEIKHFQEQLKEWGYNPFIISIKSGLGIDSLFSKIKQCHLAVLSGPSGVGKTSLINYFLPTQSLPISDVSRKIKRGRHTTRHVELFSMGEDSFLADTPGFNRPDLHIEPNLLPFLFPELRSQINSNSSTCKFRDCLHRDEPGCIINKNWQRYSYYRECLNQMLNHQDLNQAD